MSNKKVNYGRCIRQELVDSIRSSGVVPNCLFLHLEHCGSCMDRVDDALDSYEHSDRSTTISELTEE